MKSSRTRAICASDSASKNSRTFTAEIAEGGQTECNPCFCIKFPGILCDLGGELVRLPHQHTAIYVQHVARNVCGFFGRQECHATRDFLCFSYTTERDHLQRALLQLVG